ncbi:uncharacterized protein LOC135218853 [Macrobrachium nipponense]|uniref:uncharacterized protein LOC135218853 n=1 Tax=Macrobrachium nipponense TaxID=159736 RepID=UPI0030C89BF7
MARTVLVVLMAVLVLMAATVSHARYLPTRADDSRMEEIREILREILERTADGSSSSPGSRSSSTGFGYDKRFIYKRSVLGGDASNMAVGASSSSSGLSGERVAPLYNLAQ